MASPAQITANRANALLSTGPATLEGKAAVRLNAIKYGIHAESIVIPGEDPEEYQAFVEFQLDAWRPQDTAEQQCVDQLTTDSWRLNRLRHAEAKMWDTGLDALEQKSTLLDRVGRMIDRLQRSIRQITRELQRMQALRAKEEEKRIAREIAARRYSTKQSQFPPDLERFQADRDTLEE
jgi:hypothetical protein